MTSYYVKYWMEDGGTMLGGVLRSQTSRFGSRQDAQNRADGIQSLYEKRKVCYEIVESNLFPEIFTHCKGYPAQSVGAHCFGCKKLLTIEDAKDAGSGKPMPGHPEGCMCTICMAYRDSRQNPVKCVRCGREFGIEEGAMAVGDVDGLFCPDCM